MRLMWLLFSLIVVSNSLANEAYYSDKASKVFSLEEAQYAHSLYKIHCQGCHLPEGEGFAVRGVPVIKDYMAYFLKVDGGREYLVQVPGASFSSVDDQDLALLMNWMLEAFSGDQLDDDYQPYTAEEIHRLRTNRDGDDVVARRRALVELIEQSGVVASSQNNSSDE